MMNRIGIATLACSLALFGCLTENHDAQLPLENTEQALDEVSEQTSVQTAGDQKSEAQAFESAGAPSIEAWWDVPESGVQEKESSEAVLLQLRNWTDEDLPARVSVGETALGLERRIEMGETVVPARATLSLPVQPSSLPLQPDRTGAHLSVQVSYPSGGGRTSTRGDTIALSFIPKSSRLVIAHEDNLELRTRALGPQRPTAKRDIEREVDAANRNPEGIVDGARRVNGAGDVGSPDTPITGESFEGAPPPSGPDVAVAAGPFPPIQPCQTAYGPYPKQANARICYEWRDPQYRDSLPGGPGGSEDYLNGYKSPAAYANATVTDSTGTVTKWTGRLDANGCTPVLTYCSNNVALRVNTSSFQTSAFGSFLFNITIQNVLDHNISPVVYSYSDAWTGEGRVRAEINATSRQARVGAILSRMLTMVDNGLYASTWTPPTVTIDLTTGCPSGAPSFWSRYPGTVPGTTLEGEACYSSTGRVVRIGRAVQVLSEGPPYVNQPLSFYLWQNKFVIAHELGHAIQDIQSGAPGSPGYGDRPIDGYCSCEYVNTSNRQHCLQSAHNHAAANKEGFAHYYAARVFNARNHTSCAFNYYKDTLDVLYRDAGASSGYYTEVRNPPYSVNCNAPWRDPYFASTTGWGRRVCGIGTGSGRGTEYDWMTFLWAVDDESSVTSRTGLNDMMQIFGNAGDLGDFKWDSVIERARIHYGGTVFSPRFIRFVNTGSTHGVE